MTLTAFAAATLAAAAFVSPAAPVVAPARPDDRPGVVYWTAHRAHVNHLNRFYRVGSAYYSGMEMDAVTRRKFDAIRAEVRASTWRAR